MEAGKDFHTADNVGKALMLWGHVGKVVYELEMSDEFGTE